MNHGGHGEHREGKIIGNALINRNRNRDNFRIFVLKKDFPVNPVLPVVNSL